MIEQFNPKQQKAWLLLFDHVTRFLFFGGGAGGGKSWLGCEWVLTNCSMYPGVRYLLSRNVLKYLKETTLNTFFKVTRKHNFVDGKHYSYNSQSGVITFWNDSEILLRELKYNPADPEFQDLGSLELTGAFIDEATEISFKAFDVLKTRVGRQYNQKYNIHPKILLTGNPIRNWVYNNFIKMPQSEQYRFIQALADENTFLDDGYIDVLESITDPITKQRLRHGNWEYDNDPGILLKYRSILDMYSNSFVPGGNKYITCDVARKGKDKSVIIVWDGWRAIHIFEMAHNKITELAEQIQRLRSEYKVPMSNVIADEDGVGGGLVDILDCNGFINNSRPADEQGTENFDNLRSQCIYKLCSKISDSGAYVCGASIEQREKINEELSVIKRTDVTNDKKVSIMSRDEFIKQIGRSPDYLSALMQRVWFDIAHRNYKTAKFNW